MTSVCACDWDCGETLGACILGGGPRTARKAGHTCCNCGGEVKPGQRCVDFAGLNGDDCGGWFHRMHEECYDLMRLFAQERCGDPDNWAVPFSLTEAAEHAVAEGDDPFWRRWLDGYERTWTFSPEPPDPKKRRVQRWIRVRYPMGKLPPVPRISARLIWARMEVS
jgi:hypothetical protein